MPSAATTGRLAVGCFVAAIGLQVVVGQLGPSVAVPPVSASLDGAAPADPYLVTALLAVALTLGAVGVGAALVALGRGWQPPVRRLLAGAALAVLVLLVGPPLGTADLGGYAAYGRMAVLGHDPYTTTPAQLSGDPVVDAAEPPWRDIRSIYGPLATAEFHLAADLGGDSREEVLRLLQITSGVAFVATGLLLDRLVARRSRQDPAAARRRAAVLWSANPLLLHQLVGGAHLDAQLALLVLGAVAVATGRYRRRVGGALVTGALLGLAGLVKATAAAPAAGLVVGQLLDGNSGRRARGRLAALLLAGGGVAAAGYLAVGGRTALVPTREASRMVSRGTPWRFVASGLERLVDQDVARSLVGLLALGVAVALAIAVFQALAPARERTGTDVGTDTDAGTGTAVGRVVASVLAATTAWLVVAPYALPWYDAVAWALLPLAMTAGCRTVPLRRLEMLLLVHTAYLSVAYLPGRIVGLPDGLATAQDVVRGGAAPVVVLVVAIGLVRLGADQGRHVPVVQMPTGQRSES
ncbi:MAG: alpha,6-mannosyltransferase [Frankiaceae bacterium]|nr:alpha,6-mannosyltransferase [Frankiaceae bacterium]